MRDPECIHTTGGPSFARDNFGPDGRLMRLCKGGDGGAAAQQSAAASAAQSKLQHEENMRQLRKQARVAANASSPTFTPASAPTAANVDTIEAGVDALRRGKRRFSFAKTQDMSTLGGTVALGGVS